MNKDKKVHIYIVNTPFQGYIVNLIINNFMRNDVNIVYTTISSCNIDNAKIFEIRRNIYSVLDCIRFRREIEKLHRLFSLDFYIPHLNNLLSMYCYNFVLENHNRLNVYYEGIALFYDPYIKISRLELYKRKFISTISQLNYNHSDRLFSQKIREFGISYTPIPELSDFNEKIKLSLPFKSIENENSTLIIGGPLLRNGDLVELINKLTYLVEINRLTEIHYKPHFRSKKNNLKKIFNHFNNKINIFILDKNIPVESYPLFSDIYAFHLSSALINIRLINPDVKINILNTPDERFVNIVKRLNINIIL